MNTNFNLQSIIDVLKFRHGEARVSKKWQVKYYVVPIDKRLEFFKLLVQGLKDIGKNEEFFTMSTRDEIVSEVIPPLPSIGEQLRLGAMRDLRQAIVEVYYHKDATPVTRYGQ